jgi:hypothetical protein
MMPPPSIELFWIPLGAGGRSVRFNGKVYEALAAARTRRPRRDLYHAALVVDVDGGQYTIEVAPSWDADEASRGVVATGAVGSRLLAPWRLFRYEVRCWRDGSIPDLAYAADAPRTVSTAPGAARRLLAAAPRVPRSVDRAATPAASLLRCVDCGAHSGARSNKRPEASPAANSWRIR